MPELQVTLPNLFPAAPTVILLFIGILCQSLNGHAVIWVDMEAVLNYISKSRGSFTLPAWQLLTGSSTLSYRRAFVSTKFRAVCIARVRRVQNLLNPHQGVRLHLTKIHKGGVANHVAAAWGRQTRQGWSKQQFTKHWVVSVSNCSNHLGSQWFFSSWMTQLPLACASFDFKTSHLLQLVKEP